MKSFKNNFSINSKLFWGLMFAICTISTAFAQKRLKIYEDYISKYKDIAQQQQQLYKIPTSITLAQGLLESGAGKSDLAIRSNNHFGIKCHNGWTGPTVIASDDKPNDCFRKYDKVEDSYVDHSLFLTKNPRYRNLFDLDITDYRGWATNLQTSGYATDRAYANRLIKIIEDYDLYELDTKSKSWEKHHKQETDVIVVRYKHTPYKTGGLVYVIAKRGDTYEAIAKEFGFSAKDLCKYNEVPEDFPLNEGDLVYFQKKKKKADEPYYDHVVKVGESMYSISQVYGIQVKQLYKINKLDSEYIPTEGDVLKLR